MTIQEAFHIGVERIRDVSTSPELDVELILSFLLQKQKIQLAVESRSELTGDQALRFQALLGKRALGFPIAYITHEKEFYGRGFFVDERVLIPRPESELLIDTVMKQAPNASVIVDLCTGSGCVGITLKKELPSARVIATDLFSDALEVAQKNAVALGGEVEFVQGDLFSHLPVELKGRVDVIVSNPPYVDMSQIDLESKESASLRFEPARALSAEGEDPAVIVKRIIAESKEWLSPNGILLIEIGDDQGLGMKSFATEHYPNKSIELLQDLSGKDRVLKVY